MMRQYVCRSCENEEIAGQVCYCRCTIPPVGCLQISQVGEQPEETGPEANWLPISGPVDTCQERIT